MQKRVGLLVVMLMVTLTLLPALSNVNAQAISISDGSADGEPISIDWLQAIAAINPPLTAVLIVISTVVWRAYRETSTKFESYLIEELTRTRNIIAVAQSYTHNSSPTSESVVLPRAHAFVPPRPTSD